MDASLKAAVRSRLAGWYQTHRRALPWRETPDPYGIWVSEVMLQQTRVDTVIPYYLRFMARFPTVAALAAADLQAVLKLWEGLGYYARARNLHRAAAQVVAEHCGILPEDHAALRKLAGIGDYIAAAVMSIAFGRPCAVVDGNVKRVLSRLFMVDAPVNRHDAYALFERKAGTLLDPGDPGRHNQAVMELGALVCRPRQPLCGECPVGDFCRAYQAGRVAAYPKRIRKPPVPTRASAAGVIRKGGEVLIVQIPPEGLLGGLWEFPGGRVDRGESAEAACIRHIRGKTGLSVEAAEHLGRIRHAYTHFKVVADLFLFRWQAGSVRLDGPADYRWVRPDALAGYPLPRTHHKFMPLLEGQLT
jgi:A/G-specific adenine glycosylase